MVLARALSAFRLLASLGVVVRRIALRGFPIAALSLLASLVGLGCDMLGDPRPPVAASVPISAGGAHTCEVRQSGSVACWGSDQFGQSTPPGGEFAFVSAGWLHTCGVRTDSSVVCWGDDDDGESTPPDGEFASVSAGARYTCGVRLDSSVACWGWDGWDGDVSARAARREVRSRQRGGRAYMRFET